MIPTSPVVHRQVVPLRSQCFVHLGYVAILVFLFFGLVQSDQPQVIGSHASDLYQQFLSWRAWGFEQLRSGQLPLWNPHVYAGAPFIGGFQAALFYPPNWIFMVLPLHMAVNGSVMMHLLLFSGLMFHWALSRGMVLLPAALVGMVGMLGGAYFLHVYAGHLTNLCAMAWIPLILRAVESVVASKPHEDGLRWSLIAASAVCMQILAGHPQYVFYTAVAICIYCSLYLRQIAGSPRLVLLLLLIPVLAASMSAIQLLPGWQATAETIRGRPLPYSMAAMFGFPPENLLTTWMPNIFGSESAERYFGRAYLWEMSLFVGAGALFLSLYAVAPLAGRQRPVGPGNPDLWRYPVMVMLLTLLALGAKTPLYHLFYSVLPGYSKFRGTSKFIALVHIYLALLAGWGFQRLLVERRVSAVIPRLVAGLGGGLLLVALVINADTIRPLLLWLGQTYESYALGPLVQPDTSATEIQRVALYAASVTKTAVALGAAALLLLALALQLARRKPDRAWTVGVVAALELLIFAKSAVIWFPVQEPTLPVIESFFQSHPGDYRSANQYLPNHSMLYHGYDVDGVDPSIIERYAELMHFTQGKSPDEANQFLSFSRWHKTYDMIRLGYMLKVKNGGDVEITQVGHPLPTALLVNAVRVVSERDAIFTALADVNFDPRKTVLLEQAPPVQPVATARGAVTVLSNGTDALSVEVVLDQPSILLVTDLYTRSWRVEALPGSSQSDYVLLPANYILRAVPLSAGRHRLRMYYDRSWLHLGMGISAAASLIWLALWLRRGRSLQRQIN